MKHDATNLRELIEVLNDGRRFYVSAAEKVHAEELKALFQRMARTKSAIAGALNERLRAHGESPPVDGTVGGRLRHAFGEVCAQLSSAPETIYVEQLEQFEDRIMHAFREAAAETDDAELRALAAKYMPDVARDHREMSTLKQQLK